MFLYSVVHLYLSIQYAYKNSPSFFLSSLHKTEGFSTDLDESILQYRGGTNFEFLFSKTTPYEIGTAPSFGP